MMHKDASKILQEVLTKVLREVLLKLLIKGSTDEQVKLRGSCVDMCAAMCFLRVRFGS